MLEALSGTWKLHVKVGGKTGVATFQLEVAPENTIRGTYSGHLGSAQVEGVITGEHFEFWFDWHHGKVRYKGTCSDERMSGTCVYGSVGTGKFEGEKIVD